MSTETLMTDKTIQPLLDKYGSNFEKIQDIDISKLFDCLIVVQMAGFDLSGISRGNLTAPLKFKFWTPQESQSL